MGSSRRVLKVAEAIREVVSMAILTQIKDPRIGMVTVTQVEVSGDLRQAKVHVSVLGNEAQERLSLSGLKSAAGFLQSRVANRVDMRYTPRLEFVLDQGVKKSIEVARILKEVLPSADTEATFAAAAEQLADQDAEDFAGDAEAPDDDSLEDETFGPDAGAADDDTEDSNTEDEDTDARDDEEDTGRQRSRNA